MRHLRTSVAILLILLGLGVGTVSGLELGMDCATAAACPMAAAMGDHCGSKVSYKSDCCSLEQQPLPAAGSTRVSLAPGAKPVVLGHGQSVPQVGERVLEAPTRVASRLRDIGHQSLFQVSLN